MYTNVPNKTRNTSCERKTNDGTQFAHKGVVKYDPNTYIYIYYILYVCLFGAHQAQLFLSYRISGLKTGETLIGHHHLSKGVASCPAEFDG
jgi:hypothetical protein